MTSGALRDGATAALLVVPHGTHLPEPLAGALRRFQPDWHAAAVWCGDPQLRPTLDGGLSWWGPAVDERELAASDPHTWEWRRALDAAAELFRHGAARVVLLWVGSVAVLDGLDALARATDEPLLFVPRVIGRLPDDRLSPTEQDLLAAGPFSTTVAAMTKESRAALEWLAGMLGSEAADAGVGPLLAHAAQAFGAASCTDERIGAGAWRWPESAPALLDVPSFDSRRPEVLDPLTERRARIDVVVDATRREALASAATQLAGRRRRLTLPGGIPVDATVRRLVRRAQQGSVENRPPLPWGEAPAFRRWLEHRYWPALHASRPDLVAAFPDPAARHADAFRNWTRSAFAHDDLPFLLSPCAESSEFAESTSAGSSVTSAEVASPTRLRVEKELRRDGLNLVGYLTRESSLGDVARRLLSGLREANVPVSTIATQRTASPVLADAPPPDQRVAQETSLGIVTADQFPLLAADLPELFSATRRMIGYWFWELEHIPEGMRAAISLVDEIWTGSRFVADAFAAVTAVPVRHVPIPIPQPTPSSRTRASFPPLADSGGRFLFVVAFDHLSVTERKNPLGAIEAFSRAFAPGSGPMLLVKTMNADERWPQHQRIVAAAVQRPDVVVWDAHLSRADQMALVREADCLVSLHRSEGLGLHLAEAMWLGTPTIATRYSGNVDFMDDSCARLVDWLPTRVEGGQGVYPPSATWADPDLDQAAAAMRALVGDRALHARIAAAGRGRMEAQPSLRRAAEQVAALLAAGDRRQ